MKKVLNKSKGRPGMDKERSCEASYRPSIHPKKCFWQKYIHSEHLLEIFKLVIKVEELVRFILIPNFPHSSNQHISDCLIGPVVHPLQVSAS